MKLSIVTPVFCCGANLHNLYERLKNSLVKITDDFEIIMVNDASPDNAWEIIKEISLKDQRLKGINLSRNFGQHYAITAGLDFANGDWVVIMDCDLQDQPEEILKLYEKTKEGYDIVFGRRINRQDNILKKLSSKIFYKIFDYFTENKTDSTIANFSIINKKVVKELRRLKEQNRTYFLFINWLGFKRADIDIDHDKRIEGKSSYTLSKLINLAIDSIVAQSNKPLIIFIKFGFLISLISLLYAFWLIFRFFFFSIPLQGWTSIMVSLYFIGGLLFANMGVLGIYVGKIFNETKNKPLYVISETTFDVNKNL